MPKFLSITDCGISRVVLSDCMQLQCGLMSAVLSKFSDAEVLTVMRNCMT